MRAMKAMKAMRIDEGGKGMKANGGDEGVVMRSAQ